MIKVAKCYGNSMLPFIKNGSYVFYEYKNNFKKGDMVVYIYNGFIYCHRIKKVKDDFVIISNDDDLEEHRVSIRDIKGRVLCKFNGFRGYILSLFLRYLRSFKKCLYQKN